MQERAGQKSAKERRKRNRGRNQDTTNTPRRLVRDTFVDCLLPELLKEEGDTRKEATTRFENWLQHRKRWTKLVERYGSGILLLLPRDLTNDK
jgi:hypothetical protein